MDVIGNNLSNVNTTGFKKGRVNFQDMLSQSQKGAARPNETVGGVNPQQVGLGMTIASIDTIHTQGSMQTTGVKTDVAILGNGFFVMKDGNTNLYSRAGAFGLDANGTLVNPANGQRVQGWSAKLLNGQTIINPSEPIGDLKIPVGSKDPAKATSVLYAACNLDKNTPIIPPNADALTIQKGTYSETYDIYDGAGNKHIVKIDYTRVDGQPNTWKGTVGIVGNDGTAVVPQLGIGTTPNAAADNTYTLKFDNFGRLESVANAAGGTVAAGNLQVGVTFRVPGTAIPQNADPANPAFQGAAGQPILQTFNINIGEVGGLKNSSTQFAETSTNKFTGQDGYGMGYLQDFRIDSTGEITGIYSNGTNRAIGKIALASFTNPGGLEKAGDNTYAVSINSGAPDIGVANVAGKGKMLAGALEMSNVDLSETFTDMIVTQRGFQGNSKTIQTSDEMLQTLIGLKR
jgi:flagellar hook protein FlgE